MLVPVALENCPDGRRRAHAPDLPGCEVTGGSEPEVLPKLRLAIEAELTRRLLADEPLPDTRDGLPPPSAAQPRAVRWLTIDINLGHLVALAKHQAGR